MKMKAKSFGRKADLRDECGHLEARAESREEAQWLSQLYMHIIHGGRMPGPFPHDCHHETASEVGTP